MKFVPVNVHEQALDRWGSRRQLLALAEELSEASAAVVRLLNAKGEKRDVLEELVDVESVTESLRRWLGPAEEWAAVRDRKRAKLAAALEHDDPRTRGPSA